MISSAVDSEDGRVQVEDDRGAPQGTRQHLRAPAVVKRHEFVASQGRQSEEETSESRGLGVMRETGEVLEDAVATQPLGGFDAAKTEDQRIEQRLDGFADGVFVVALGETDPPLELAAQTQLAEERVQQSDPAEGGQPLSVAGNSRISRSSAHRCRAALLVRSYEASPRSTNIAVFPGEARQFSS